VEVPISIVFLVIVVVGAVAAFFFLYSSRFAPSSMSMPVTAKLPAGNLVYRVGNSFIVTLRFSKTDNSPPIGVCAIGVNYVSPSGQTRIERVVLAQSPTNYANSGSFSAGTVSLSQVVLYSSLDATLTVTFNGPGYHLNSVVLYYCRYGVSTNPEWSETLLIPEVALTP